MKIKQTRESDFKEIEIDVEDELYNVAEEVREYFATNMIGIIVSEDGEKLSIRHQVKDRYPGERDTHAYKITIEKIKYD